MRFSEAVKGTELLGDEVDVVLIDKNNNYHRLLNYSTFSEELIEWLMLFDNAEYSEDEEAIIVRVSFNTNELGYLLDGEVPCYYPEYTDDYYGSLAENTYHSFEERLEIIKERNMCLIGG